MQVRLNKLGNSMVIRVPNFLIKQLNLKENTPLNLSIVKKKLIVEKKQRWNGYFMRKNHRWKPKYLRWFFKGRQRMVKDYILLA